MMFGSSASTIKLAATELDISGRLHKVMFSRLIWSKLLATSKQMYFWSVFSPFHWESLVQDFVVKVGSNACYEPI